MLTFSRIRSDALPECMRTKAPYQLRGERFGRVRLCPCNPGRRKHIYAAQGGPVRAPHPIAGVNASY
jgi:hypothetical protein